MRIRFDVRELRQLWVKVRLAFLMGLGMLVVAGVGLWLLFQKSLVGAFLFLLLMAAAAFVVRYGLKVKDHVQEDQVQKDVQARIEADNLDGLDRQIVAVGVLHPEYTDAQIQTELQTDVTAETVRKRRDALREKGYPVFNDESLKRKKPKE